MGEGFEAKARKLMESGERILWYARPRQGIRFGPADWFIIPFSVFWFGFAILWTGIAIYATYAALRDADLFEAVFIAVFPVIGALFCLAGFQFAVGRFFGNARERANTYYALSNRRAFILRSGDEGAVKVLPLTKDSEIGERRNPDGSGSIVFLSGVMTSAQTDKAEAADDEFAFTDLVRIADPLRVIKRIKDGRV
jgi:hypothetical protein